MYRSNLQYLEEVFPNGTFNLSQPIRESDGGDDLIDLNPTEEDRFEDEDEGEEEVPKPTSCGLKTIFNTINNTK